MQRIGIMAALHEEISDLLGAMEFVKRAAAVQALRDELPDALCVEMEGATVAQICHEYGAGFAIVRTVSDRADDTASHDFSGFLAAVASHYSAGILRRLLDI